MAKNSRTPVPKTQRELSVGQHKAFDNEVGNPNYANGVNRGDQISFTDDSVKPFSIGIQDIDEAVFYYFKNVIKPFVLQNGERIEVPIIYGSPEKWASFQKFGYFRDSQGRIMMPILMFKRDSIEKVRSVANKLDANNPNNISIARKSYSSKNAYNNFSVLNNVKPQKVNYAVVIPDYVTVTYSCAINTYYMDQLNKIIEAIEYASDSYWGDPSRFQFRAMIDSFAIKTELADKEERTVSSTFGIKMNGYIIPDVLQKDLTALKKIPDVVKITVTEQIMGESNRVYTPQLTFRSFDDSFDDSFG